MAWKLQTLQRGGLTRRAEIANDFLRYRSYERNKSDLPIGPVANAHDAVVVGYSVTRRGLREPKPLSMNSIRASQLSKSMYCVSAVTSLENRSRLGSVDRRARALCQTGTPGGSGSAADSTDCSSRARSCAPGRSPWFSAYCYVRSRFVHRARPASI